jgi:hypothetical protein
LVSQMAIISAHEKFFRSSRTFRGPQKGVDHIKRIRKGEGKRLACPRPKDHPAASLPKTDQKQSYSESRVLKPLVGTLQQCPSVAGGLVPHGNSLRNLNDVGSKQNRHPEALIRIEAHLGPGNDGVRCLNDESRIQELPHSAGIPGALSSLKFR